MRSSVFAPRCLLALVSSALVVAPTGPVTEVAASPGPAGVARPNIVMIVVDDMRFDEFGAGGHPYLETPAIDRLAAEGALFTHAWHVTPLCSPNRASLLTGQYASRHGILDNTSRSLASHRLALFARELQHAGYRTAHIGKWHMGNDPTPRPGYDYWVSLAGQGRSTDPELYEGGRAQVVPGYVTDLFTDRALRFIDESADRPFFVWVGHKAIHPEAVQLDDGTLDRSVPMRFVPAPRHAGRYEDRVIERAPSYGLSEATRRNQPILASALDLKRTVVEQDPSWDSIVDWGISEETVRRRAEMMLAVDEGVGRILERLEEKGILDHTLVLLTSDNGYFYGEHGLTVERRLPYEEALRAPLVMRLPGLVGPGTRPGAFALSIDLAPTILDVAGVEIPGHVQGRSLVPVLSGDADSVRERACMEYYSHEGTMPWTVDLDYRVVRRDRFKYIRWTRFEGGEELYDMQVDPHEQVNLALDRERAALLEEMRRLAVGCVLEMQGYAG
jgi:N-acetylglucosamine-6-sulfatase